MKYLYIFEDGSTRWATEQPTLIDSQSVDAGVLTVIRFEGSDPEELTLDEWIPLSQSRVKEGPEGPYHCSD